VRLRSTGLSLVPPTMCVEGQSSHEYGSFVPTPLLSASHNLMANNFSHNASLHMPGTLRGLHRAHIDLERSSIVVCLTLADS
jgi:hypothetical protein